MVHDDRQLTRSFSGQHDSIRLHVDTLEILAEHEREELRSWLFFGHAFQVDKLRHDRLRLDSVGVGHFDRYVVASQIFDELPDGHSLEIDLKRPGQQRRIRVATGIADVIVC